jgi:predicted ribosome quality control (RQC) complex YloA/Tae2 family protein
VFDSWTTAAMAAELAQVVVPSRVQQVVAVDGQTIALELYAGGRRHYLLASASRQAPRLLLAGDKVRRGVDPPSPLLQALRKLVRGAGLVGVSQPPWERILHLDFQHPSYGRTRLVAELMGRWANLLLLRPPSGATLEHPLESWRIMACVHTVRPPDSVPTIEDRAGTSSSPSRRPRPVVPGGLYQPPPLLRGLPLGTLTAPQLGDLLAKAGPDAILWRTLVSGLQGLSPPVAREISWRTTGDADARVAALASQVSLLATIADFADMVSSARWQPCVVLDAAGTPVAFAPYPLAHRAGGDLGRLQSMDSISAAAGRYFQHLQQRDGDPYATARAGVARLIEGAQERLQRRRDAIARELLPPAEIEALRSAGEWILALASQIGPRQDELAPPAEAGLAPIPLDSALSPADNAARYFQRYRKARRAAEAAGPRLAAVDADLAYLAQLAADLRLASERGEIDAVTTALDEAGLTRSRVRAATAAAAKVAGPRRFVTAEGYPLLVGRNARQNEQVTFDLAGPDDLWLHARGVPGAHVVIRSRGQPVSEATLTRAAGLAAYYSTARAERWVDVVVAPRRRVRRAPGGRPGMVMVERERVLRVQVAEGEGAAEDITANIQDNE